MDPFGNVDLDVGSDPALGWSAFTDLQFMGTAALILVLAVSLAALIAYHPATRRRATTLEDLEQPKTYVMYSMVGAVVALIVKVEPSMALVVFGIGGLLRFRTDVGRATDTGRVILVTVVGLCCGLELFVVAALATVFGWILVWLLESKNAAKLVVQGLERTSMAAASKDYLTALRDAGCTVVGQQQHMKKGSLVIVFRAPPRFDRVALDERLAAMDASTHGTADVLSS